MHHLRVAATTGFDRRASSLRDIRLWLLAGVLVVLFVLDVRLPEVVLLPFMVVPVVAAAAVASARATATLAVVALGLGVVSGVTNGDFANDDYWYRLLGVGLVAALAVYLAHVGTQRERRLAEGERRLQLMLDNTADAVFLLDSLGVTQWVSPAATALLGCHTDDLVGRERIDLVHFEDRRSTVANIARVSRGESVRFEERVRTKSGEYRWMSVALRPFTDGNGASGWYVASLLDTHEDVLLRDALARSERMFRLAMDGAVQGMAVVGLHQRLFEVNAALCELTRRDAMWLADHYEDDLLHAEELEATRQMRDRLLAGKADRETRASRLLIGDGSTVEIEHAIGLLRDEHGLPLFFVCQYTEIRQAGVETNRGHSGAWGPSESALSGSR
jgi:PAS domain S-box-containing protein